MFLYVAALILTWLVIKTSIYSCFLGSKEIFIHSLPLPDLSSFSLFMASDLEAYVSEWISLHGPLILLVYLVP